jgi:predicted hydrolase (HD superfamily)
MIVCPNRFGLLVQRVVYSVIDLRDLTRRFAPKAFGAGAQIEGEEVRRSEINDKWIFK